jgi:hypothetical protein
VVESDSGRRQTHDDWFEGSRCADKIDLGELYAAVKARVLEATRGK